MVSRKTIGAYHRHLMTYLESYVQNESIVYLFGIMVYPGLRMNATSVAASGTTVFRTDSSWAVDNVSYATT